MTSTDADDESREWLRTLTADGRTRDDAIARLRALLLRIARAEVNRRAHRLSLRGPELDDLAHQAASDALLAILDKLDQFRGESRFTTWAYKFVVFDVSAKVGRHFWRNPPVPFDTAEWERLPDRFGFRPEDESQWRDLLAALRRAVEETLTPHQRRIFVALVVDGIPLDALVLELGSNRNAIYKTMYDARRKLRAALVAGGHLTDPTLVRQP